VDFTDLFVDVDDFYQSFGKKYEQRLSQDGIRCRQRRMKLSPSEVMTIVIAFQSSRFREFKHFYFHLQRNHRHDFPDLISYSRFIACLPRITMPLFAYLLCCCLGTQPF
jgi:hypothetical protein